MSLNLITKKAVFVFGVNIDTEALFSDDIILQKEKERHTGFERHEGD